MTEESGSPREFLRSTFSSEKIRSTFQLTSRPLKLLNFFLYDKKKLHILSFNFLPPRNQIIVTFPTITSQLNFNLYSFLQTTYLFHQIIQLKKNKDGIAHKKSQIYFLTKFSMPYFSAYFHLLKLKHIFQYSFLLHICPPISRLRCGF